MAQGASKRNRVEGMRFLIGLLIFLQMGICALLVLLWGWAREIAYVLNGGCM